MKRSIQNKGFSLVELIVAIAILSIVGAAAMGFFLTGSKSYQSVNDEVNLQYEAQLVMNQIEDLLIDANKGVGYDSAANMLYVYNEDSAYSVGWNSVEHSLTLSRYLVSGTDINQESSDLMAEYVTGFSITIPEENNRRQTVSLRVDFETGGRTASVAKHVTLRNKLSVFASVSEAYPDMNFTAWTITGVEVLEGDTPVNLKENVTRGTTVQFKAKVLGDNNPPQDVIWQVESKTDGVVKADDTTIENGLLKVSPGEHAEMLEVTVISKHQTDKKNTVTVTLTGDIASFDSVTIMDGAGTVAANPTTVAKGNGFSFKAVVNGTGLSDAQRNGIIWTLEVPEGQSKSSSTGLWDGYLYIAPDETAATLTVVATSSYASTCRATVDVQITGGATPDPSLPPVVTGIEVYCAGSTVTTVDVVKNNSLDFEARVLGENLSDAQQKGVTWTLSGGTNSWTTSVNNERFSMFVGGSESSSTLTLTATSTTDANYKQTVTIRVSAPVVTVTNVEMYYNGNPVSDEIRTDKGAYLSFSAKLSGSNLNYMDEVDVSWAISGAKDPNTRIVDYGWGNAQLIIGADESASKFILLVRANRDETIYKAATIRLKEDSPTPASSLKLIVGGKDVTGQTLLALPESSVFISYEIPDYTGGFNDIDWNVSGRKSSANTKFTSTSASVGELLIGAGEAGRTLEIRLKGKTDGGNEIRATMSIYVGTPEIAFYTNKEESGNSISADIAQGVEFHPGYYTFAYKLTGDAATYCDMSKLSFELSNAYAGITVGTPEAYRNGYYIISFTAKDAVVGSYSCSIRYDGREIGTVALTVKDNNDPLVREVDWARYCIDPSTLPAGSDVEYRYDFNSVVVYSKNVYNGSFEVKTVRIFNRPF